jgi:hypothetical protein
MKNKPIEGISGVVPKLLCQCDFLQFGRCATHQFGKNPNWTFALKASQAAQVSIESIAH